MTYKKYDKYKGSLIDWIGNIPEHWEIKRTKDFCEQIYAGGTPDTKQPEYWENGSIPRLPSGACQNERITSYDTTITEKGYKNSSTKYIPKDTTIIAMTGATCANVGYTTFRTCANQSVTAFVENKKIEDSNYLYYTLQGARNEILLERTGGAQAGINTQNCKNYLIPMPPLTEQQAIAKYLDERTENIDKRIELLQKKSEKYKTLRKNLISHIITKGLNPNVKMKDSGIEWVGNVPEHWEMKRLRSLAANEKYSIVDGPFGSDMKNEEYTDFGVPIVQLTNIKPFSHYIDSLIFITEEKSEQLKRHSAYPGDIVIAKMMPAGRACLLSNKYEKYILAADAIKVKLSNKVNKGFVLYCLNSYCMAECDLLSKGVTRIRISLDLARRLTIFLPPLEEQKGIANYLDNRTSQIDKILNKIDEEIEKLKQLRKVLINDAVTGKIKVI